MADLDDADFDRETGEIIEPVEIPEIAPTASQSMAIAEIKEWYLNRSHRQQVFRLFGYAGTGKTTITKYAAAELGLSMFQPPNRRTEEELKGPIPNVFFAAYTGKAAYVMRKHGTPASTIHAMITNVLEATPEQVYEAEVKLHELMQERAGKTGMDHALMTALIEAQRMRIRKMKSPDWEVDELADVRLAKLIVLDEVSMVNEELAGWVLSFGVPVLVIGDPGQLPPVRGEGAFINAEPDVMLEEIHRQALDSPIIRLATMARQGISIPFGKHGETVYKLSKFKVSTENLLRADQVICGLNATRYQLNAAMRNRAGFASLGWLPSGITLPDIRGVPRGEKVICLRNINREGLINGMFMHLHEPRPIDDHRLQCKIIREDGSPIYSERLPVYTGEFIQHYDYDIERNDRDWEIKKGLVWATYGWAITCHKAQGSQYNNVIVYNDGWGRGSESRKWLYTSITRAVDGLVILE